MAIRHMIPTHELDKPFICLQCEAEIEAISDLQNPQPVKKGNIVICWNCGALHKVGDGGLIKFSKFDFAQLDEQSKNKIAMTVTAILKRNQREQR